ncbi:hypothetical protein BH739_14840 [Enterococcus casseliflavus]|jgi:hypothetical protein|nr:hypothetical protein BH739_14840 [Enterococcus casseliflavus]
MRAVTWHVLVVLAVFFLIIAAITKSVSATTICVILCVWLRKRSHLVELPTIYQKKGLTKFYTNNLVRKKESK